MEEKKLHVRQLIRQEVENYLTEKQAKEEEKEIMSAEKNAKTTGIILIVMTFAFMLFFGFVRFETYKELFQTVNGFYLYIVIGVLHLFSSFLVYKISFTKKISAHKKPTYLLVPSIFLLACLLTFIVFPEVVASL